MTNPSSSKKSAALRIGAHTSASGGAYHALYEAKSIGANVTQFFTANQRRWESKPIDKAQIDLWKKAKEETGIYETMSHASYLINLAAPDPVNLQKSFVAMQREIERCLALEVKWLNFHPGSSVNGNETEGLDRIVSSLLALDSLLPDDRLEILLELTAGQGTQLGAKFEEIRYIIDRTKDKLPIGVCLDTCHVFAAGYDLRGIEGWNKVLSELDEKIGLKYLRALHLNDSIKDLGSHVDRHAPLGEGKIGWECFFGIVTNSKSAHLPMFLETPLGVDRWKEEIRKLREVAGSKERTSFP